jgi:hypothetical protein
MQVGSSCDNFLSKLIEEKGSHHSNHIPVMDFIDISSSDDDVESWDIDGQRSPPSRILHGLLLMAQIQELQVSD